MDRTGEQPANKGLESRIPAGASHFDREVQLRNGENMTIPSLRISRAQLYTGSPVSGISTFKDSDEVTIGNGVYLTSQRESARGYALVRGHRPPRVPTIYEVEVQDMDLADLRTRSGEESFAKLWKQELIDWRTNELPTLNSSFELSRDIYWEKVNRVVELVSNNKFRNLRALTWGFGELVRKVLSKHGYNGLIALEGGESGNGITIGEHDSWIIFDPNRVKKISEEVAQPDKTVG